MELTLFSQKWYMAYQVFNLGAQFASEMAGIQKFLRNPVAHGRNYVADDFQLEQLERRLAVIERWIEEFAGRANAPESLRMSSHDMPPTLENR